MGASGVVLIPTLMEQFLCHIRQFSLPPEFILLGWVFVADSFNLERETGVFNKSIGPTNLR